MKIGNVVKTVIKWAPIIYPIVKKIMENKSTSTASATKSK